MPQAAEKWEAAADAIPEEKTIEVDDTPLGGDHEDDPVDLEAEREARESLKRAKAEDRAKTSADLARIRADVAMNTIDRINGEPIKHHRQFMEGYPTTPIPDAEKAGGMMTRKKMDRKDKGFFGRMLDGAKEWLAKR